MSDNFHFNPAICGEFGIEIPEQEVRFHPTRRWRFDFAWRKQRVAVEINGGVHKYGRHNRATGYLADLQKINAAQELGWCVLQYTPKAVDYNQLRRMLAKRLVDKQPY